MNPIKPVMNKQNAKKSTNCEKDYFLMNVRHLQNKWSINNDNY